MIYTCAVIHSVGTNIGSGGQAVLTKPVLGLDPTCPPGSFVLQPIDSAPLTIDQGIELGWAVGGVWLTVYAIVFLIRYLRDEMRDSHVDANT